jgi:hypothetical protein
MIARGKHLVGYQVRFRRMGLPDSPSTFFKISTCRWDRPNARTSCLIRFCCPHPVGQQRFYPQAQPWFLPPLHSSGQS